MDKKNLCLSDFHKFACLSAGYIKFGIQLFKTVLAQMVFLLPWAMGHWDMLSSDSSELMVSLTECSLIIRLMVTKLS